MPDYKVLVKSAKGIIRIINFVFLMLGTIGDSVVGGGHRGGVAAAGWQLAHWALAGGTLMVLILLLAMASDGDSETLKAGDNWLFEICVAIVFAIITIVAACLTIMEPDEIVGYYLLVVGLIVGCILWLVDAILLIVAKVK